MKYFCPRTGHRLQLFKVSSMMLWYSRESGGRLLNFSVARKLIGEDEVVDLLKVLRETEGHNDSSLICPACDNRMKATDPNLTKSRLEIDICDRCRLIWVDKDEYKKIPNEPKKKIVKEYPTYMAASSSQVKPRRESRKRRYDLYDFLETIIEFVTYYYSLDDNGYEKRNTTTLGTEDIFSEAFLGDRHKLEPKYFMLAMVILSLFVYWVYSFK